MQPVSNRNSAETHPAGHVELVVHDGCTGAPVPSLDDDHPFLVHHT